MFSIFIYQWSIFEQNPYVEVFILISLFSKFIYQWSILEQNPYVEVFILISSTRWTKILFEKANRLRRLKTEILIVFTTTCTII